MVSKQSKQRIREAVGIFSNSEMLEAAINQLVISGFKSDAINLLAGEGSVRDSLGDFYIKSHKAVDSPMGPKTAFVVKNHGTLAHDAIGSLLLLSATISGGVLLVSAGAFGSPLLAAFATAPLVGGVTAVLLKTLQKSDADYLEEQLEMGHMLLFVRTENTEQETAALTTLSAHTAYDAKIYNVGFEQTESV